ncbi:MAG: CAP domain-containing protein [Verrucomicrobia bacterium]|nr:CAP domain-containing protein [Verrucomicrobiota bacterium]MDA1005053.1 CAP domain-containing protein [Verrucomicrobiota bacterium]
MTTKSTKSPGFITGLALSGIALFLASCSSSSVPTATELTTMVGPAKYGDMGDEVGSYIADFRGSNGRSAQTRHEGLDKLARMHAQRMLQRGKMDHDNYHHRLGMAEDYYHMGNLRENVAYGRGFAKADMSRVMVDGWIGSKGHRANLLALNTYYGVGVAIGEDGSFYSVHLTATPMKDPMKSAFRPGMPISYSNKYGAAMGPEW